MERVIGGVVVAALVLGLTIFGRSMRAGSASEDALEAAHVIVMSVEGYDAKPEYYDWLVDVCHEAAFDSAYVREGSRRRDRSYLDEEKYLYNLFTGMMRQAGGDRAEHISLALQKFRDAEFSDPEGRR